jgi:aldehyde:ferredoxin oxidoreductase
MVHDDNTQVGELLDTLEQREDLWGEAWHTVQRGMARVDSGDVRIECVGSIGVAVSLLAALPCLQAP